MLKYIKEAVLGKKTLSYFIVISILFSMTTIDITKVQAEEYNNILYSLENDEITITGVTGLITEIEIPSEILGYPVTKIAEDAFYQSECYDIIKKVTLANTITSIGNYAFAKCEKLKYVNIPKNVTYLGESVFSGCWDLKNIFIYNTLTHIDDWAFDGCTLENIYYSGSEDEFNNISIGKYNEGFTGANIFFNCDHAHNFVEYISDNNATCETDCTETAKCTECDATDTRIISGTALGHDWGDWIVTKSATITETGEKQRICKNNGTHIETLVIPVLDSPFAGGSGTEEDPYQVSTPEQLNEVRNYLDKHFIQINDIDMTDATSEGGVYYNNGEGWIPIGNIKTPFTGTYNGKDYTINGLTIKNKLKDSTDYIGLFGVSSGSIYNVKLTDGTVELSYLRYYDMFNYFAGGIVGYNEGIIKKCYNSSKISSGRCAGGIAGKSTGEIIGCYNTGNIKGFGEVAGIVAVAENKILKCYNSGKISGGGDSSYKGKYYIGGIVGELQNGILSNCYNTGRLSFSVSNGYGYLCGYSSNSEIENSYCFFVGGIVEEAVGEYNQSTFNNIYIDIADCNKNVSVYISTDELKKKESFVGFDFDTVWDISPAINDGYPYLQNVGNFIPTYSAGDINGDGYVDFIDAQLILKYDAGLLILTDEQISRSDLNGDGYIDFIDAQIILKYDAGLIDTL